MPPKKKTPAKKIPAKKTPANKAPAEKKTDGNKEFVWSDDEAEYLLNVTHEYSRQGCREYRLGIGQK